MHGVYLASSGLSGDLKRRLISVGLFLSFFGILLIIDRREEEREREREREAYQDTDNDRKNIIMEVLLRVVDCGPGWLEDGKGTRTMDGSLFYFSSSSACLSNGLSEEWSRIG